MSMLNFSAFVSTFLCGGTAIEEFEVFLIGGGAAGVSARSEFFGPTFQASSVSFFFRLLLAGASESETAAAAAGGLI